MKKERDLYIRVTKELKEQVSKCAETKGVGVTEYVTDAVMNYLKFMGYVNDSKT